jgi:hypothetical protein
MWYWKEIPRSMIILSAGPGAVAYTCNLPYSKGRDREDYSSRPAQVKS